MAQIPVVIRCRSEFLDRLLPQFEKVEMTRDSITGFPVVPLNGLRVIVDDDLEENYKVEYKEGPSVEEIKQAMSVFARYL